MVLWNNFSVRKNSGIEPVLANPQQHRNPASMNKVTSNTSWYRLGFGYDTTTGQPTWRINTFTQTASIANTYWAGGTNILTPGEIDLERFSLIAIL